MKLIRGAGYKGLILYEAELCHKYVGKKKKGRMDITLPYTCTFEVHGREHERRKLRSDTCASDALKRVYSVKRGVRLVELYVSAPGTWAPLIGAALNNTEM